MTDNIHFVGQPPNLLTYLLSMERQDHSPLSSPELLDFFNRLNLDSSNPSIPHHQPDDNLTGSIPMISMNSDGPLDEGFHEEWPPFRPSDLMQFMSVDQSTGIRY